VLGCTHYPILQDDIEAYLGYKVNFYNMGKCILDSIEIKEYPGKFEITYEVDSEKIYVISHILGEGFLNDIAQRDDYCGTNQMERFLKEQYTEFYNMP